MNKKIKYLLKVTLPFVLFGCGSKSFYHDSYDNELARIPMIEPYQVFSPNQGLDWFFYLTDKKGEQLTDIDSIGVKDSIFAISCHSHFVGQTDSLKWCIVDTKTDLKYILKTKERYLSVLDSLKSNNLKLYEVKSVFISFNKSYKWPAEWPNSK